MKTKMLMILLALLVLLQSSVSFAADDGYYTSYTYNYDFWGDVQESPDAYRVAGVINSVSLGLERTTFILWIREITE